jgi:hypothetical protein
MGMRNRSENGRGAWVALCADPTHTGSEPVFLSALTLDTFPMQARYVAAMLT